MNDAARKRQRLRHVQRIGRRARVPEPPRDAIGERRLLHGAFPDQFVHPDRGHDCMDGESMCFVSRPRRVLRWMRREWRWFRWVVK